MSAPLTVAAEDEAAALVAATVASLPMSFAPAADGKADVAVVSGTHGWPERVRMAAGKGVRAVIVIEPRAERPEAVEALAADLHGMVVALSEAFAGTPAVADLREAAPGVLTGFASMFLTATAPHGDPASLLLRQLRVVRALGTGPLTPGSLSTSDRGLTWSGRAMDDGTLVTGVAALTSAAPEQVLVRAHTPDRAVEIDLPSADTARPASIVLTDTEAASLRPTSYETAHRATWRRVHAALGEGVGLNDLAGFADDLRALNSFARLTSPTKRSDHDRRYPLAT